MYWILFFFVAFGAKALLACAMIHLLLSDDAECSECGGTTLLLRGGTPSRIFQAFAFGRVRRRWCPRCGWEGMVRARRGFRLDVPASPVPSPELERL
jgi:hypothetical protein